MDYAKHYQKLIARAENRTLVGYSERHHIVPRCMDKTSKRTVRLTPEEHFVAHQLLVKMHPEHYGLAYALAIMTGANEFQAITSCLAGYVDELPRPRRPIGIQTRRARR